MKHGWTMDDLPEATEDMLAHFESIGLGVADVGTLVYDSVSESAVMYCGVLPSEEHLIEVMIRLPTGHGPFCSQRSVEDITAVIPWSPKWYWKPPTTIEPVPTGDAIPFTKAWSWTIMLTLASVLIHGLAALVNTLKLF